MKSGKGRYELADTYGVHGSSRFAKKQEIFKQGETIDVPVNQLDERSWKLVCRFEERWVRWFLII